jgi:hypothetical protein
MDKDIRKSRDRKRLKANGEEIGNSSNQGEQNIRSTRVKKKFSGFGESIMQLGMGLSF